MLDQLNKLEHHVATEVFRRCCGVTRWCLAMADHRPYSTMDALHERADLLLDSLSEDEWLEAFACHPQIGDLHSLKMKYAGNREWSAGEQAGVQTADESILVELAQNNAIYRSRFGFIFIVCATGKSAGDMLKLLNARIDNSRSTEIENAAAEQRMITHLRLDKLEIGIS